MHAFQQAIENGRATGDAEAVMNLLAEDVVFRSPVVFKPYAGRAAVEPLMRAVVKVFDEFGFTRHIGERAGSQHAFVFRGRIGDREVEGCDFIRTRGDGLIDEFFVMIRPLSAAIALAEAMQNEIAGPDAAA